MVLPQNSHSTFVQLGELVDEIWYLAGDRSLDFNWYSKRGLLAGVYTSTEMFMALDSSPDFQNTFKFLDRRLADVGVVGKTVGEASAMLDYGFKTISSVIASKTNY